MDRVELKYALDDLHFALMQRLASCVHLLCPLALSERFALNSSYVESAAVELRRRDLDRQKTMRRRVLLIMMGLIGLVSAGAFFVPRVLRALFLREMPAQAPAIFLQDAVLVTDYDMRTACPIRDGCLADFHLTRSSAASIWRHAASSGWTSPNLLEISVPR
ncbi:MAG: hypothetical protein SNJ58_08560, partial [Aggregatilineales bacterium]